MFLQDILRSLSMWVYQLTLDCMGYITNGLLYVFDMNLEYFEEYAPIVVTTSDIISAVGLALLLGNLVFQALRAMLTGIGFDAEDPKILAMRTFVFMFLLFVSRQICDIGLSITGTVMDLLQIPNEIEYLMPLEAHFGSNQFSWMLVGITGSILSFQILKFFFAIALRHVVVAVLTLTSPLAFAMGGSKSTEHYFKSWVKLFGGSCLMMVVNLIFLKLLISALGNIPNTFMIVPWIMFVVALSNSHKIIEAMLNKMDVNVSAGGGGMRGAPIMLTLSAARSIMGMVGGGKSPKMPTSATKATSAFAGGTMGGGYNTSRNSTNNATSQSSNATNSSASNTRSDSSANHSTQSKTARYNFANATKGKMPQVAVVSDDEPYARSRYNNNSTQRVERNTVNTNRPNNFTGRNKPGTDTALNSSKSEVATKGNDMNSSPKPNRPPVGHNRGDGRKLGANQAVNSDNKQPQSPSRNAVQNQVLSKGNMQPQSSSRNAVTEKATNNVGKSAQSPSRNGTANNVADNGSNSPPNHNRKAATSVTSPLGEHGGHKGGTEFPPLRSAVSKANNVVSAETAQTTGHNRNGNVHNNTNITSNGGNNIPQSNSRNAVTKPVVNNGSNQPLSHSRNEFIAVENKPSATEKQPPTTPNRPPIGRNRRQNGGQSSGKSS